MREKADRVRRLLGDVRRLPTDARVLEVGSGAHGLIFSFGAERAVGVDPLAANYASLFPAWQRTVPTVAASGEQLPFPNASFDVVLCDNVVDHAAHPEAIVAEIARVLAPEGLLYFTVNVHHPVYGVAAGLHAAWNAAGLHWEIGPFADHTVHLSPARAKGLFAGAPLLVLHEAVGVTEAKAAARRRSLRNPADLVKRVAFKNAHYELVAQRAQ